MAIYIKEFRPMQAYPNAFTSKDYSHFYENGEKPPLDAFFMNNDDVYFFSPSEAWTWDEVVRALSFLLDKLALRRHRHVETTRIIEMIHVQAEQVRSKDFAHEDMAAVLVAISNALFAVMASAKEAAEEVKRLYNTWHKWNKIA